MKTFIRTLIACAVMGAALAAGGCELFRDPAAVQGALPSEATELRIIRAALTVRGAYAATTEELQRGTITTAQAVSVKAKIDEAAKAVTLASCATGVPLPANLAADPLLVAACAAASQGTGGTLADRLALVDQLLLAVLRAQKN